MKMSRIEGGVRLVLAFAEAFNRHDSTALGAMISECFTLDHFAPAPDGSQFSGRDAAMRFWENLFQEQPLVQMEVENVFGLGRHCVLYWQITDYQPDAQPPSRRGITLFKIKDGELTEMTSYVKGG